MHALDLGRGLEIGQLGLDEGVADRDGTGADPQLVGELGVDPLAVLDELVVAVLEAGPGDEGRTLARAGPAPSRAGSRRRSRRASTTL